MIRKTVKVGERDLIIETGRMAKQADGAIVLRYGDTMLLATSVSAREKKDIDFMPLTVEYKETFAAAGRIPGGYFRREGRLTEKETLTCRIVDRACRPLFPEGYAYETQVLVSVMSFDKNAEPDVLALCAASASLAVSDIPFDGPIACVRVGRIDGKLIVNPDFAQRAKSDLDLVVAASKAAIVMVEGGGDEILEADMVLALDFGMASCQPIIAAIAELRAELGVKTREFDKIVKYDEALKAKCKTIAWAGITKGYAIVEKHERYGFLKANRKELEAALKKEMGDGYTALVEKHVKGIYEDLKYEYMRDLTCGGGRIGGRPHDKVRAVSCEISPLPRTHGSAIFQRGETQALVTATLGTGEDDQRIETLAGDISKTFMLHYNFPPFSVNETKPLRGPGRREIGHGALAERALKNMLPDKLSFPYVVRVVSDILESNGSSSMASVCGGTLAMMDAGVPIKSPVAGIAMGLVKEGDKIAILSDILGDEDHLGDMDFKVCGTAKGITAVQMDIKITGITTAIMLKAMEQAKIGRLSILETMLQTLPTPRKEISQYAPRITSIMIRPEYIKNVIGPGGKVIKDIIARTGCSVNIDDTGKVDIASADGDAVKAAISMIQALTREAEVGKIYLGTVRKIVEFGAFVELFPGTDGLIHISELADKRVKTVDEIVKEGDEVMVKVISIDSGGKIRLSRKQALAERSAAAGSPPPAEAPAQQKPTTQA
ncbi:MAG: polyribonucleotide nucleotidyltransferase [Archangium sp.]|nr:polyribonucleotide nucleotidyltransferase [Archangium sp.]MDP3156391.1 polyribonucleotide nucleotidyltransferase [Archangium sp.]MDP3573163.1 polyribonucleotide nucleotidyltransferase [Archangium sp.]